MRQDSPPAASAGQPIPLSAMAARRLTRYSRLPERIVLCIDVSPEMGQPWSSSSPTSTRLDILKQALNAFLHFKSIFNPRHEYALVTVDEEVSRVVLPFTPTVPDVCRTLDYIAPVGRWPPAAAPATTASGINLAHLLGSTLPSLLSNYLKKDKNHTNHKHKGSSSSHPALARAILLMGASYALPLLPERSVVEALFANDNFFFDMMYIHARKTSPPLPPPPPPPSSSTAAEVVVVDLDNDEDEVAVVERPTAAAALPPSLPPPLVRQSDEIWSACLDLFMDHHPLLPESGYCFSVMHGSNTDRVMTPLQLLLAHPAQRLPQTLAEERLNYRQGQRGGKGGRGKGGGRRMKKKEEKGEEVEEEGGGGGRMEVTTPSPREGGVGVGGSMS